MAVTGTFLADFSSFSAAVQKAEVELRGMETSATKVGGAVNRIADQFSGRKLIQDAELMTKAITEIGGASVLTEKEQARVNATLTEAIAKYQALGQVAPKALQELAEATKRAEPQGFAASVQNAWSKIQGFAGPLGIGLGIGAVVGFGKSLFDTASEIGDTSDKLHISAEAFQRYAYAAEMSGATSDDVTAAITKMTEKLAGGHTDSLDWALKQAHLQLDTLRGLGVEGAFNAITEAVAKIPDPITQTRVAVELLGKDATTLLPAIHDGFVSVGKGATVMSDQTVANLKAAQDTWTKFGHNVTVISANLLNDVGTLFSADAWKNAWAWVQDLPGGDAHITARAKELLALQEAAKKAQPSVQELGQTVAEYGKEATEADKRTKDIAASIDAFNKKISEGAMRLLMVPIGQAVYELEKQIDAIGGVGEIAQSNLKPIADQIIRWQEAGWRLDPVLASILRRANAFTVVLPGVEEEFKDVSDFFGVAERNAHKLDLVLPGLFKDFQDFANLKPRNDIGIGLGLFGLDPTDPLLQKQLAELDAQLNKAFHPDNLEPNDWKAALGETGQLFQQLAQISDGSMSSIVRAMGTGVTAVQQFERATESAAKGGAANWALAATNWVSAAIEIGAAIHDWIHKDDAEIASLQQRLAALGELDIVSAASRDISFLRAHLDNAQAEADAFADKINAALGRSITPLEKNARDQERLQSQIADALSHGERQRVQELQAQLMALQLESLELAKQQKLEQDIAAAQDKLAAAQEKHLQIWKDMKEVAEKYNIDLGRLGITFQQSKMDDMASELVHDWHLLVDNGADVQSVITGMTGNVKEFLRQAKESGVTIPSAMRPLLEAMEKAGVLVDDDGTKLVDLGDLNWNDNLKTDFSDLHDDIELAVQAVRDLITELENLGKVKYTPGQGLPDNGRGPARPPLGSGDTSTTGGGGAILMASGGMGRVNKPTLFLAGEAGPEDFAFSGAGRSFAPRSTSITFNVTTPDADGVRRWVRSRSFAKEFVAAIDDNAGNFGVSVAAAIQRKGA